MTAVSMSVGVCGGEGCFLRRLAGGAKRTVVRGIAARLLVCDFVLTGRGCNGGKARCCCAAFCGGWAPA